VGKVFLMPERIKKIDRNLSRYGFSDYSTSEKIYSYIQSTIGYPCFIKPNRGTKGIGVYKCFNNLDVQLALREYEKQCSDIVIVEQFVDLPDYRVNVLGDKVICCYLRKPLAVTGDGKSTIGELIQQKQDTFIKKAKPPLIDINDLRISQNLKREDYSFHAVLSSGQKLNLHDFSNLPSGGEAVDYTEVIHPYWKDLCVRVTKELGLLISGIDLFCAHIEKPNTRYSILEINSTPGLENYAALGKKQEETVRHLYMKLFNQSNPHFQL
jgi:D-alanine-D-alanine ligase-like ATP-grasp enzyme